VAASLSAVQERGEWVLVLAGARGSKRAALDDDSAARARFVAAQIESGASREDAERRADFVLGGRRGRNPRNA
jgi:hypothetical protein